MTKQTQTPTIEEIERQFRVYLNKNTQMLGQAWKLIRECEKMQSRPVNSMTLREAVVYMAERMAFEYAINAGIE